jgi:hypothetical protein
VFARKGASTMRIDGDGRGEPPSRVAEEVEPDASLPGRVRRLRRRVREAVGGRAGGLAVAGLLVSLVSVVFQAVELSGAREDSRIASAHATAAMQQAEGLSAQLEIIRDQADSAQEGVRALQEQTDRLEDITAALKVQSDATQALAAEAGKDGPQLSARAYFFVQKSGDYSDAPIAMTAIGEVGRIEGTDVWLEIVIQNKGRGAGSATGSFAIRDQKGTFLPWWGDFGDGYERFGNLSLSASEEFSTWTNLTLALEEDDACALISSYQNYTLETVSEGSVPFSPWVPSAIPACEL